MNIDRIMDDVERRGRELSDRDLREAERQRISEAREREHQRTMDSIRGRMERDAKMHRMNVAFPFVMFVVVFACSIIGRIISNWLIGR